MSEQLPSDSRHARQLVRRQLIAEAVLAEGSMRIEDLIERFGISLMTAHRDVDELVSRGLFRKQYTGRTLREHLGLPRVPNLNFSSAPQLAAA